MTKKEAIRQMVELEFHPVPTEWVKIVANDKGEFYDTFPMWGTMWFIDEWMFDKLKGNSHVVCRDKETMEKYGEYEDDEMAHQLNVNGTNVYLYEIEGEHLVGVHGAGYDFYDGVWDRIYDIIGLKRHDDETVK